MTPIPAVLLTYFTYSLLYIGAHSNLILCAAQEVTTICSLLLELDYEENITGINN